MGFETINLNDIQSGTTGEIAPLPVGDYNFRLLSVSPNKYQEGGLSFDIVVTDGKYAKRRVFPTLPAPKDTSDWSAQAIALLAKSLGIEQNPGETVMDALNRAATNGHSTFTATTKQYTKTNGDVKPDLQWFSVRPSVQ